VELGGSDVTLKTSDEQRKEVNEILEKEVMSDDDIRVESDVRQSVEVKACVSEKIDSQKEKEIEDEE
ncbi:hypothetical protein A2U01_0119520, partial [Trifolium medium]|nr:hypothetical protein [Trifolium medium]